MFLELKNNNTFGVSLSLIIENNSQFPLCACMCKDNIQMNGLFLLVNNFALQDHKNPKEILLGTKMKTTYRFLFCGLEGQR